MSLTALLCVAAMAADAREEERPSPERAMAQSCLLPGWGQLAKGENEKARWHARIAGFLIGTTVATYVERDRAVASYNRLGPGSAPEEFNRRENRQKNAAIAFQASFVLTLGWFAYSGADARFNDVEELIVRDATLHEVFPALLSGSARPLGSITLENRSDTEAHAVRISLESSSIAAATAEIPSIPPRGRARVELVGTLTDAPHTREDVPARIDIRWEVGSESRHAKHSASVRVHPPNVITWDDPRKLGAFVTPRDPTIRDLSASIVRREIEPASPSPEIALAAKVFDAVGSLGLSFAPKARAAFRFYQGNADAPYAISPVRETLAAKSGDLPDLVALIASAMESVGVRTALVELEGTLLLAIDGGKPETHDDSWLEDDGRFWIPLDATSLGNSFGDAWSRGAALVRAARAKGETIDVVPIAEAHARYAPQSSSEAPLPLELDEKRFGILMEADRARLHP